jgi:hypothetical protein
VTFRGLSEIHEAHIRLLNVEKSQYWQGGLAMSEVLAYIVNGIAGLGSLVCFILVLIHLFQTEQTGLGVVCIVLIFACGIGALIAFIKGLVDDLGTVMWVWTGCIALGLLTNFVLMVGG